jgi:hypothetical protein
VKLRALVLVLAALLVLIGTGDALAGRLAPGSELAALGVLGILGTAFEQWRYRKRLPASACWKPTGERFEDPSTGEPVEVLYDPLSGERRYERL